MTADKSHRGNASQFFVAGELCRRGYAALVTIGNTPNTDILCSNKAGTRFVHIQVKTFVPGRSRSCNVGLKAETNPGERFFWILAGIPEPNTAHQFEYFIIPAAEMAKNVAVYHQHWLATPGKNDQAHKDNAVRAVAVTSNAPPYLWSVEDFREKWSLLKRELDA